MNENILRMAIAVNGEECQKTKCIEEVGEFLQAMGKLAEAKEKGDPELITAALQHLHEEIADALIMLHQMRLIYGPAEVDRMVIFKICRLEELLDESAVR